MMGSLLRTWPPVMPATPAPDGTERPAGALLPTETAQPFGAAEERMPGGPTGGHMSTASVVPAGVEIVAERLGAVGPEGQIFRDVHLAVPPNGLLTVVGPAGSGRTALLLALAGRFRLWTGAVRVDGYSLPGDERAVRRLVGIGRARPAVDLEERLRVDELVAEGLLINRSGDRRGVERAFELLELAVSGRSLVQELTPLDRLRLSLALGLVGKPRGLVVDDVDEGIRGEEVAIAWALVRRVQEQGVTLLTSASAPAPDAGEPVLARSGAAATLPRTGNALVALPHAAEASRGPSAAPSSRTTGSDGNRGADANGGAGTTGDEAEPAGE